MKTLQFAIASVLDASLGQSPVQHSVAADHLAIDPNIKQRRSRNLRNYLQGLRRSVIAVVAGLRKRRKLKQNLRQLGPLSDRQLDDIGFTRGDIIAAENGYLNMAQLELQRSRNRDIQPIFARNKIVTTGNINSVTAQNDAAYARARCA